MKFTRRRFLRTSAAGGVFLIGMPHIWIKNADLALAADGEIKVGVLFSLTGYHRDHRGIAEQGDDSGDRGNQWCGRHQWHEDRAGDRRPGFRIRPLSPKRRASWSPATNASACSAPTPRPVARPCCLSWRSRTICYWYPTLYEGRECSKNVIYTGAVPNQQQDEFIPWLIKNFGKKFSMIGSNYIYPKEENNYCRKLLQKYGAEVVNEEYVPLGHSEFSSVINKFRQQQPNVIFSTVVGDSVVALHRQYKAAGLDPAKMPMASLTTSENEIAAMGGEAAAGHFTSAPYFEVHKSPENEKFVAAYKKRWGADKVTAFRVRGLLLPDLHVQAGGREARQGRHYAEYHPRSRQGCRIGRPAGQGSPRARELAHLAVAEDRAG